MYTRQQLDKMSAVKVLILALFKFFIGPAVRLVTLYNRHELINNRVMERLLNCLRNEIYITCSMYDELKSLEDKKEVDR